MARSKTPASPAPAAAAEWVHVDTLRPWDKNPRLNDGKPVEKVAASIARFGFVAPVVVWREADRMVAGHTRLKALKKLLAENPDFVPPGAPGPGLVPVRFHAFASEAEADAYAIADNRLSEEAEWDYQALSSMLRDIQASTPDLVPVMGWDPSELDPLLRAEWRPAAVEEVDPRDSSFGISDAEDAEGSQGGDAAKPAEKDPEDGLVHTNAPAGAQGASPSSAGGRQVSFDVEQWKVVQSALAHYRGNVLRGDCTDAEALVAICRASMG